MTTRKPIQEECIEVPMVTSVEDDPHHPGGMVIQERGIESQELGVEGAPLLPLSVAIGALLSSICCPLFRQNDLQ